MKQGWTIETISSLCEQMNGIWKGAKEPLTTAKILRTTNFSKDCQMKLDDLAIIEVEQKKMEKRRLKRGDIIVEKSGGGPKQPVGRVILFNIDDDDFSFCNFTSALRIKDQTKILPEFLHKYLTYLYFSGETEKYQSNLVGFRNLDFKGYVSISVKYPPLSEQQRIVALLDAEFAKIDTLKANAEKNLQNAKDLYNEVLKRELMPHNTWNSQTLDDVCTKIVDGTHNSPVNSSKGDYMYVTAKNIKTWGLDLSNITYVTSEVHREIYDRCNPEKGDVLYIKDGATTGIAIVNPISDEFSLLSSVALLKPRKDVISGTFLCYAMNSPMMYQFVREQMDGAAITRITLKKIKSFTISYPSLDAQNNIVARLDTLNEKCKTLQANYEKTLSLCDDLKCALLRKVFGDNPVGEDQWEEGGHEGPPQPAGPPQQLKHDKNAPIQS